MEKFLIQETPGKVLGFTTGALFSMALLFAVSLSNASFRGTEYVLANPFAPKNVVSVIDAVVAGYSSAVMAFTQPAREAIAIHVSGIKWIVDEAAPPIAQALGIGRLSAPQVAGVFTKAPDSFTVGGSYESINIDDIYWVLIGGG